MVQPADQSSTPSKLSKEDKGNKASSQHLAQGGEHRLCDNGERASVYMPSYSIFLSHMSIDMSACFLSLSHALE